MPLSKLPEHNQINSPFRLYLLGTRGSSILELARQDGQDIRASLEGRHARIVHTHNEELKEEGENVEDEVWRDWLSKFRLLQQYLGLAKE